MWLRTSHICVCLLSLFTTCSLLLAAETGIPSTQPAGQANAGVAEALAAIREKHGVPAIAAAIVTSNGVEAIGVAGVRKKGTDTPATMTDKWHLGSDTKAMTATLIGKLVERGQLRWDMTMAEVFPDLAESFNPDAGKITIAQLLTHRAGLPGNLAWWDLSREGTVQQQRLAAVKLALSKPPKPGHNFEYSNLGYVIAGAVVEKVTGKDWEQEIQQEIFIPLHMDGVGFGSMAKTDEPDQPWEHSASGEPVGFGRHRDNPPIIGPAGRVHCSLEDWAKFVGDQLRGARGEDALLKAATYRTLQSPPEGKTYAMGWGVAQRDWAAGRVLTHDGSNGSNYASAWLTPNRDFAILVCTNQGGPAAKKACAEAVAALVALHDARHPRPQSSPATGSSPASAP